MFDAPESPGGGPEPDGSGPVWRHALRQVGADLLAALDRHWIGAVWGASAACYGIGLALDAPRLAALVQVPVLVAITVFGANRLLDAYGSDWRLSWRPPSRWRLGRIRETVAIHRVPAMRLVHGTVADGVWEPAVSSRIERTGPGVCVGPLEVSRGCPAAPAVFRSVVGGETGER